MLLHGQISVTNVYMQFLATVSIYVLHVLRILLFRYTQLLPRLYPALSEASYIFIAKTGVI